MNHLKAVTFDRFLTGSEDPIDSLYNGYINPWQTIRIQNSPSLPRMTLKIPAECPPSTVQGRGAAFMLSIIPINNIDLSVLKRVTLHEHYSVEFGAGAFNVLNHAQYIPGTIDNVNATSYTANYNFHDGQATRSSIVLIRYSPTTLVPCS